MDQMGVRINEARKHDASAKIESTRAAGFAKAFNAAKRADGGDASIVNQQGAIANDSEIGESGPSARGRTAKGEEFGAAGDQQGFHCGCQRY